MAGSKAMIRKIVILMALSLCGCVNWGVNAESEKANALQVASNICAARGDAINVVGIIQDGGNGSEFHTTVQYHCVGR